jgi:hypothetical protein
MVEELSERWGKFIHDDDESMGVALDGEDIAPLVQKGKECLIGKLLADRIMSKVHLRAPLLRIWRPGGKVSFQIIGGNLFVMEFEEVCDKLRILEGCP